MTATVEKVGRVRKRRYLVLGAVVLVFCGLGFAVWDVERKLEVERELEAVFKTQARDGWNLTPEGTNAVRVRDPGRQCWRRCAKRASRAWK